MNTAKDAKLERVLAAIDRVMMMVAVVAVFALLLEWGWRETFTPLQRMGVRGLTALVITFFLFETFAKLLLTGSFLRHIRNNLFETLLTAAFLIVLVGANRLFDIPAVSSTLRAYGLGLAGFYLLVGQVYIFLSILMKIIAFQKHLSATGIRPAAVLVGSFIFVILIGTVLLSSPHAVAEGVPQGARHGMVDSLFTATSAVCVTGLIVRDTGSYFSTFGQAVILVLIQIGGLGLMTFVTFSSLLIGKGMALREQAVMQNVLSYDIMAKLPRLIVYILLVTFITEALGALALFPVWEEGQISIARRVYLSVFHSVSSFCNAGFCLFPDSFVRYRGSGLLTGVVTGLVIFGGLGFLVHQNLAGKLLRFFRSRRAPRSVSLKNPRDVDPPVFFTLQTRIVLVTTAALLAAAFIIFALLEYSGVLAGMTLKEKFLVTWFQSVTPRTAGFNTVGFGSLRIATYIIMVVLMFIGASPGSTGGGIKTSTFAILLATVYSALRRRPNVETMRRAIPYRTVRQAVMVALLGLSLVLVGLFALTLTEDFSQPGVTFERLLFEQVSAFGTVGLSPGTPGDTVSLSGSLSSMGKLVIIATMFAGRIGPLTLVIAIAQRRRVVDFEYPSEQVVIG